MRWIDLSALPRLVLIAAIGAAVIPAPASAQTAQDDVVVLIDETFDNPDAGELTESEGDDTRRAYERGAFVVEGIGRQFTGSYGFRIYDVVADGTIAVDVRLRGPVEDRLVFLGCRDNGSDAPLGYVLLLDLSLGDLVLLAESHPDEGDEVYLTDYVAHGAIRTGNRTNRIALSCIGSTISARVNGVEVVSATDDRYQVGHFSAGVGLYGSDSGPVEGVFDNLLVTTIATPNPSARRDARELDQVRAEAQERPSLFGPAEGEVRSDEEEFVSDRIAGVDVRDFYARATFVNPYDVDEQRWDVGIAFRDTGSDENLRLVLRSSGRWYLIDGLAWPMLASGPASAIETATGGENTIEVAVVDETGYVALNGEFLATFDASPRMSSGDVWVGSAFFVGDNILGDRTAFRDFEVWGLGEDAAPAEPETTPETDAVGRQPRLPRPRDPGAPAAETASEPAAEVTCADFTTQEGAQYALDITSDDAIAAAFDPDGDGIACDDLPSRADAGDGGPGPGGQLPQPRAPTNGTEDQAEPAGDGLTDEDLAYLEAMYEQFDGLSVSMTRLNQVLDDVNSGAMEVEEGRAELQDIFKLWAQAPRDAESLDPPPTSAETQELYLEFVGLLAQAADDLSAWLADGDDARLDAGIEAFNQAVTVQGKLEAILADAGILP